MATLARAMARSSLVVAGDRLVIGELGLIGAALRDLERVGGLVEPLERRVAGSGELLDAIVGLLGEGEIGRRRFAPPPCVWAISSARVPASILREIGRRRRRARPRASRSLRHQFRIVDLEQQLASRDIVAALDRALRHPAVDPRGDVDARGVGFALDRPAAAAATRYQSDRPTIAATMIVTMIAGARAAERA